MNNKFSDYIESDIPNQVNDEKIKTNSYNTYDNTESTEKLIDKYSKYSTDELMNEFIKLTEEKKRNGTLNSDIERYNSILDPYLTEEQKSKMNDLFNKVK